MPIQTYRDLEVWQKGMDLVVEIYQLANMFPQQEIFALTNQIRRAVVSIPANIAEGHGRWHYQENIQYCRMARGSIEEILDDLSVCLDESYGEKEYVLQLKNEGYLLIKRVNSYIAYLRKCRQAEK